ncbi:hypothetical protein [Leucobacter massiliensis]|nr:hypothetical protein [Leucobacter massiliensis]
MGLEMLGAPEDDGRDGLRLARALFPAMAAELDAAYAATAGGADVPGAAGQAGGEQGDFDAWLDARAAQLRTEFAEAPFAEFGDAEVRERLAEAHAAARRIAGWVGLPLPEPEAFAAVGADVAGLAAALGGDPTLAPVFAPHGLGAEGWRRLFARGSELRGAEHGGRALRLALAGEVEQEFALLDAAPGAGTPAVRGEGPVRWTLRLVPAGLAPPVLGLGYAHGPHASLPEMLMLQLERYLADRPLLDARSFTWLAGPLADGRLAARHVYDAAESTVRISSREPGNQGPHLGSRPPIG